MLYDAWPANVLLVPQPVRPKTYPAEYMPTRWVGAIPVVPWLPAYSSGVPAIGTERTISESPIWCRLPSEFVARANQLARRVRRVLIVVPGSAPQAFRTST